MPPLPEKFHFCLASIARYWAASTDLPLPEYLAIPDPTPPPECLLLEDTASEWTGILQPLAPRLWQVTDYQPTRRGDGRPGAVEITYLPSWGGPPPEFPSDTRATAAFFRRYTEHENKLHPPEFP